MFSDLKTTVGSCELRSKWGWAGEHNDQLDVCQKLSQKASICIMYCNYNTHVTHSFKLISCFNVRHANTVSAPKIKADTCFLHSRCPSWPTTGRWNWNLKFFKNRVATLVAANPFTTNDDKSEIQKFQKAVTALKINAETGFSHSRCPSWPTTGRWIRNLKILKNRVATPVAAYPFTTNLLTIKVNFKNFKRLSLP